MWGIRETLLVNILGHAGGALIFAIFLRLLFSGRGWSGAEGRNLSGLAAALALAWNLGSLVVLAWPGMPERLLGLVVAVSFSVLSLLPAVLLHISLKESRPVVVRAGYLLSAIAVVMHFSEIFDGGPRSISRALLLITVGFLVLTAAAVAGPVFSRTARSSGGVRIAASMCLALFAMSFLHFGTGHADQAWSGELVDPPRRHPAGPVRYLAGLPLRSAGCVRPLSGQRAAGRRADLVRDRSRISPGAGGTRRARAAAGSAAADQRLPLPGVLRLAAQPRASLAHPCRIPAGQRRQVSSRA